MEKNNKKFPKNCPRPTLISKGANLPQTNNKQTQAPANFRKYHSPKKP